MENENNENSALQQQQQQPELVEDNDTAPMPLVYQVEGTDMIKKPTHQPTFTNNDDAHHQQLPVVEAYLVEEEDRIFDVVRMSTITVDIMVQFMMLNFYLRGGGKSDS